MASLRSIRKGSILRKKLWVGCNKGPREVFRSAQTPTEDTHGDKYFAVIGPFRTRRGATFMAKYGRNNPHCLCVADAERIAKKLEA
jgi:hypothetical protein